MSVKQDAKKQLAKIRRKIKRIEKRGYSFDLPNELKGLTQKGKEKTRYTKKEVEKLSNIKAKDLYKYAKYTTSEGNVLSGEEGRKYERRKAGIKGYERRKEKKNKENLYDSPKEVYDAEIYNEIKPYEWITEDSYEDDNGPNRHDYIEYDDFYYESDILYNTIIWDFFSHENFPQLSNDVYSQLEDAVEELISYYGIEKIGDVLQEVIGSPVIKETWLVYDSVLYLYLDELDRAITAHLNTNFSSNKIEERNEIEETLNDEGENFYAYFK